MREVVLPLHDNGQSETPAVCYDYCTCGKARQQSVEGYGVNLCRIKMSDQVQEAASRVAPDSARLAEVLQIQVRTWLFACQSMAHMHCRKSFACHTTVLVSLVRQRYKTGPNFCKATLILCEQ